MAAPRDENRRATSVLASLMIAMSFVAMIIPLAMYHLAQIAAASGWRRAMGLLAAVTLFLLLLGGLVGQPILLFAAANALAWLIPFAWALSLRQSPGRKGLLAAAALLMVVPAIAIASVILPAPVADFAAFIRGMHASMVEASQATGTLAQTSEAQKLGEIINQWIASPDFSSMRQIFEAPRSERLLWLVFGAGSPWLFGMLLMSAGNLILLDLAFEQVEKLRSVLSFVQDHPERFSEAIRAAAPQITLGMKPSTRQAYTVIRSSLANADQTKDGRKNPAAFLFRPASRADEMVLLGTRFTLLPDAAQQGWRLRTLRFPLWFSLSAVVTLILCGFLQTAVPARTPLLSGDPGLNLGDSAAFDGLVSQAGLALMAAAGLAGSTWLAIEGALVILARVNPIVVIILLVIVILSGSAVAANPLLVIAVLGTVGLLDHIYDFRKTEKFSAKT